MQAATAAALAAPGSCQTSGSWEICFQDLSDTESIIIDKIVGLVNATQGAGDQIRLNTYNFTGGTAPVLALATALKDAKTRGVDVRLVLDDSARSGTVGSGLISSGIPVKYCAPDVSCIPSDNSAGNGFIDHSKFATFKSTVNGVTSYTSVVTSMNFVPNQHRTYYQNLVIRRGDVDMYNGLNAYWNSLNAGAWGAGIPANRVINQTGWNAILMPQDGDPVAKWLNAITGCSPDHRRIFLMASTLKIGTRTAVGAALKRLRNMDCNVRVIAIDNDNPCAGMSSYIEQNRTVRVPAHDKVLVVDALLNGQPYKTTWTGSANIVYNAIRGSDEMMLRIEDDAVADMYVARFQTLFAKGTAC